MNAAESSRIEMKDPAGGGGWVRTTDNTLLDEDERTVLRRLAVFAASFSLEAAEHVCGDDRLSPADVRRKLSMKTGSALTLDQAASRWGFHNAEATSVIWKNRQRGSIDLEVATGRKEPTGGTTRTSTA